MPEKLLYSTAEACERLNVGRTKLFELIRSGELESVQIGSARLIPADACADLVGRLRQQRPNVARLAELIDEDGRIDIERIPPGTTLADLEALKRAVASRLAVA
jgi:excisionase family DNA binding protein